MYDTIVIGNDFSSLIAAVTSVHYGKKTILVSDSRPPDIHAESGYIFNIDPAPLTGLGPDHIFSRFFSDIGIPFDNDENLHLLNPALQVIFPNHRIDLFNDINKLMEEIRREFPETVVELRRLSSELLRLSNITDSWTGGTLGNTPRYYGHVIHHVRNFPEIMKRGFSLLRILLILNKYKLLELIFKAKLYLLSGIDIDRNALFSLTIPYILSLSNRKLYYYTGGIGELKDSVKKAFISYGGDFIQNGRVNGIIPGKAINISLEGSKEISEITGRNLIISTKSDSLSILLGSRKMGGLKRHLKKIETPYYAFTLHMGILNKGIPEKMSPHAAIVVEENTDIMDNNVVFVAMSRRDDTKRAPANKRALSATIFLKDSPSSLSNIELESKSESIIRHLESVIPFLKENIDYFDLDTSIKLSREYEMVIQRYRIQSDLFFNFKGLFSRTPPKNIHLTGGILPAGLGYEGEIISGINAVFSTIRLEKNNHG